VRVSSELRHAHWDVGVVLGGTDFVGPTMAPQVAY
jgi:hypothetical protein